VNTLRKTYPFLLAGLVVVAIAAPMAQGTGSADRLSVLEKKVKALSARVATLESQAAAAKGEVAGAKSDIATVQGRVTTLETGGAALQSAITALQSSVGGLANCVRYKVMPLTDYDGYVYTTDGGKTLSVTTALDITDSGQTPQAYAAMVNPSCVGTSFVLRPAAQIQRGTTAFNTR
jgi:hypothetical protein